MNKTSLREKLKKQRMQLSRAQVDNLSTDICNNCVRILNKLSISSLHLYISVDSLNEVSTRVLRDWLKQNMPEVKVAYTPFVSNENGFKVFWLENNLSVEEGFLFDVIVVPCLGFDTQGYRIGYGAGYYDKFLLAQPRAEVIGLCFDFGLLKSIPHESHDVPVNTFVTDKKIYTFGI